MSVPVAQPNASSSSSAQRKGKDKKDKSQKKGKAAGSTSTAEPVGFSLVGQSKDAELEDVFGKSVSQRYLPVSLVGAGCACLDQTC